MSLGAALREKIIEPLRIAQGTPESIARGGALGLWVALTPTVGAQSLMVGLLAVPFRANLPIALVMCWVTNPLTLVPFYFAYYWVGALLLDVPRQSYDLLAGRIMERFQAVGTEGVLDAMLPLGREILWPMLVGSLVLATLVSVPAYHVLLAFLHRRFPLRREGVAAASVQGADPPVGSAE